jgi:hypothetical protein
MRALELFQFGSLSHERSSSRAWRDEQIFIAIDVCTQRLVRLHRECASKCANRWCEMKNQLRDDAILISDAHRS